MIRIKWMLIGAGLTLSALYLRYRYETYQTDRLAAEFFDSHVPPSQRGPVEAMD